jgi:hypothetical protein
MSYQSCFKLKAKVFLAKQFIQWSVRTCSSQQINISSVLTTPAFVLIYSYFQDGLKTMEHFGSYVGILTQSLTKIRQKQDDERKKLTEMRNLLRTTPVLEKEVHNLHCIPVSGSLLNVLVFLIF